MMDPTRTPSAWRTAPPRGAAPARSRSAGTGEHERGHRDEDETVGWLSFRDFAAIQIAAALKGTNRDLAPRETAEVAFDLAVALEEERERRRDRGPEEALHGGEALPRPGPVSGPPQG